MKRGLKPLQHYYRHTRLIILMRGPKELLRLGSGLAANEKTVVLGMGLAADY